MMKSFQFGAMRAVQARASSCALSCGLLCVLLFAGGAAQAHLGGTQASVQADGVAWQAPAAAATSGARFTVFTHTTPEGVKVRQFVSITGLVFAVAWDGPVLPDMERLLGDLFPLYQNALQQRKRSVRVDTPALSLESGGMMRAFVGRAYLPGQLPAGVNAVELQ
jgi:hypothetical protein